MSNRDRRDNAIRHAIDAQFSGVVVNPRLRRRVLREVRRKKQVKKKISWGLVLAIVLMLASVTALAVAYLSAKEVVEQQVLPMALQNDSETTNERFSTDELKAILDLAEKNGIALPDHFVTALEGNKGYWEQEVIMALAKSEFGPIHGQWTLEQQHWFGEVMVSIGFRETNPSCLPGEGEISLDEAMEIIKTRIMNEYGDDVTDTTGWTRTATYEARFNEQGVVTSPPSWFFQFHPTDVMRNEYVLTMKSDGEITSFEVQEAPDGNSTAIDVIRQYSSVYGGYFQWSPEVWAAVGKDIKGMDPGTHTGWVFQNANYILPPENGVSFEQAAEIALRAVNLEYTTVSGAVCCQVGDTPIWKVETHTKRPEDIGSGKYTAVWLVEIDCMTGEVLEQREFIVGSDMDPLTCCVPWAIIENLPPIPPGPNG